MDPPVEPEDDEKGEGTGHAPAGSPADKAST